eukprot:jgi/Bigna1/142691/aug1.72_g17399
MGGKKPYLPAHHIYPFGIGQNGRSEGGVQGLGKYMAGLLKHAAEEDDSKLRITVVAIVGSAPGKARGFSHADLGNQLLGECVFSAAPAGRDRSSSCPSDEGIEAYFSPRNSVLFLRLERPSVEHTLDIGEGERGFVTGKKSAEEAAAVDEDKSDNRGNDCGDEINDGTNEGGCDDNKDDNSKKNIIEEEEIPGESVKGGANLKKKKNRINAKTTSTSSFRMQDLTTIPKTRFIDRLAWLLEVSHLVLFTHSRSKFDLFWVNVLRTAQMIRLDALSGILSALQRQKKKVAKDHSSSRTSTNNNKKNYVNSPQIAFCFPMPKRSDLSIDTRSSNDHEGKDDDNHATSHSSAAEINAAIAARRRDRNGQILAQTW